MHNKDIIVQGSCQNTPVNILLDTGASISLVSTRLINSLNLVHEIMPTSQFIAGLDKKIVPTRGEIKLPINFGNMQIYHTFVICDNLDSCFLMGLDCMRQFELRIDIPKSKVYTAYGEERFLAKPVSLKNRLKIRCNKTITLPANTGCYIMGKVPICNTKLNYEGVIEGYNKLSEEMGIFVTGTLSYSDKNVVPVHCLNVMPHDVTLYKNQLIAFMDPFEKFEDVQGVYRVQSQNDFYNADVDINRLPTAEPEHVTRDAGKWENTNDLLKLLGIDEIDISPTEKQQLKTLIAEYSHCFSRNRYDLGKASFYEARINLKRNYIPKWVPSRPVAYKLQTHMDKEIYNLEKSGQITKCNYSLWNSAVFLVGKSNGSYRFVQDARALNKQCLQDNFELPKINTILDGMTDCNYLSSFDFTSSFTQIGLEESSQPLTAFSYNGNRYQWNRLVMGQTSSSSQFSRCMAHLFSRVPFKSLLCYIDDILMGSKTVAEHLKRLRFIFDRLSWGNLKLSPKKTFLMRREIKFLGHILSRDGLKIDDAKVKAIQALCPPTTVKQLQKFLGVLNYQRSYIKGFAEKSAALYKLLQKGVAFNWSKECQDSFESLKTSISTSPVLAIPDTSDPLSSYQLTVDSSRLGQGATLTQIVGGRRRVIAYWSRAVPKSLQRHGASRLEFIALHGAIKFWRLYLKGTRFTVLSDCIALLSLDTIFSKENAYMQRRLADLAEYNFTVKHISGRSKNIQMADFLSRYPYEKSSKTAQTQTEMHTTSNLHKVLLLSETDKSKPVTIKEIRLQYSNDKILSEVIRWISEKDKPTKISYRNKPAELCHYFNSYDLLRLKDGILYRKYVNPNDRTKDRDLIVVPCTLIERIVYSYHDTVANCHSGPDVSLEQCRRQFYFYKMANEFRLYIAACLTCNRNKQAAATLRAPLKPIVYSHFGQGIAIDHLEPSKKATSRGIVALLTIVDMYSNYLVCVPVRSMNTEESIKVVINHWILKHGYPEAILHDLGSAFTSGLFQAVMKTFGIKDTKTTGYFSQCNGRAEAMNKRINTAMRVSLHDNQWRDYDLWIGYIVYCLNSLASTRTGYSANYLTYGRDLYSPRDLFLKDDDRLERIRSDITETDYKKLQAYNMYRQMSDVTRKVRDNSEKRAMYMKKAYDRKVKGPYFEKGQLCFLLVNAPVHKYQDRYRGPYLILDKINDHNYIVDIDGVKKVVSISKMKPYLKDHPNNKYAQITAETLRDKSVSNNEIREQKPKNPPKRPKKVPPPSNNDSSDDEDWFITVQRPRTRSFVKKRPKQSNSFQAVIDITDDSEKDVSGTGTQHPIQVDDQISTAVNEVDDGAEASHLEISGVSDSDFTDALEAQEDANQSREEKNTGESSRSQNFDSLDDQRFALSNIQRHEKDRGLENTLTTGAVSRSVTAPDLTRPEVSVANPVAGRSGRYNLRLKPTKTTRFQIGSPKKALKKIIKKK